MAHSFTLHDLPLEERPRERFVKFGAQALSTQELLQLILGRGVRGKSVSVLAQELLTKFKNLQNLTEASVEDLQTIKGIGPAKAIQLHAVFEINRRLENQEPVFTREEFTSPEKVAKLVRSRLKNFQKEHFFIIGLDTRNRCSAIILAHNHPSGSNEPSDADIQITNKLISAGKILDIHILDHVIVTSKYYFSFKKGNLMS